MQPHTPWWDPYWPGTEPPHPARAPGDRCPLRADRACGCGLEVGIGCALDLPPAADAAAAPADAAAARPAGGHSSAGPRSRRGSAATEEVVAFALIALVILACAFLPGCGEDHQGPRWGLGCGDAPVWALSPDDCI